MKRFLLALLILLFTTPAAFAAWTIDVDVYREKAWANSGDTYQTIYILRVTATSDGDNPDEFNLTDSTLSDPLTAAEAQQLTGGLMREIITDGDDTAHPEAFTLAIDGGLGGYDIVSITTTETGGKAEIFFASEDLNKDPLFLNDLQLDFGDIGDADDVVVVYFIIVK